jgi:hypothetical protein
VFVKLHSVAYVSICCLPHLAIMCHHERGSKTCIFYSLDRRNEVFFGCTWKGTSWRARCFAGCPWRRHGCLWATMRVGFARKKHELTINTFATSNRFFLFSHTPTHASARNSRTTLRFKTCKSFY